MSSGDKLVLVTGGAGYIGSVLVEQLLDGGWSVRTIDKLMFGGDALSSYLSRPGFEFVEGDICNADDLRLALEGADAVVHLAAIVGDPACKKYPELAVKTNKNGSELLCEMAVQAGVNRFIFASTCSNYGAMLQPDGYVDETSPLSPVSLYAELKVNFEKHLLQPNRDDFATVCLRFATAHGLSPRPRFDLTVNEFTRDLVLGKELEIYGEQFWRPYCHTTDLARAAVLALEADATKVAGKAFNVGDTAENYQKKTLVELILERLPQMREKVRYVERSEDPRNYRVNFDRINSELRFKAKKTVADGISEYILAIQSGQIKNPEDRRYTNL
ncbi:MAG: NAD(P)-dependent oxidoreductase [Candidatus Zixiibacteriota bacterium]|nr:MAG: NAD(P)-dependent oxidoreductase [candidate division Zixibacteria bacterium]